MLRRVFLSAALILSCAVASAQCATGTNGYLRFSGSPSVLQHVSRPQTTALTGLGDFTVELWFRILGSNGTGATSATDTHAFVATQPAGDPFRPLFVGLVNGQVEVDLNWTFPVGAAFVARTQSATTYDGGSWHHAAVIRQASQVSILIDGVGQPLTVAGTSLAAGAPLAAPAAPTPIHLGSHVQNFGFTPHFTMNGDLDDVRIWSVARTPAQIQQDRNRALSGTEPGLLAYWRFDEGAGPTAFDFAGTSALQNLDATLSGAPLPARHAAGGTPPRYCPLGLLVNPSFEAPCWHEEVPIAGPGSIPGWTGSSVDWVCTLWPATDGNMSIDLNAVASGSVSQTFATVSGAEYLVTFSLAGNPGIPIFIDPPAVKQVTVSAAGASATFAFDTTGRTTANLGWRNEAWRFTAVANTTTLAFQSITPNSQGPVIDRVVVTPIDATSCPAAATLDVGGDIRLGGAMTLTLGGFQGLPFYGLGVPPRVTLPAGCTCQLVGDGANGITDLLYFFASPAVIQVPIPLDPQLFGAQLDVQGLDVLQPIGGCSIFGVSYGTTDIFRVVLG